MISLSRLTLAGLVLTLMQNPGPARAGAWTEPRGGYYLKLEAAGIRIDQVFDAAGNQVDYISALSPGTYQERQVRVYAEYGLAPRLTLVGATAYQNLEVREEGAVWNTWGLSDIRIGARYGLTTGNLVSALAVDLKIPSGYDPADFPALGSGDPDLGLTFLAGHSFGRTYLNGDAGYNLRSGNLENEWLWSAEAGWTATTWAGLRTSLRGRSAMGADASSNSLDPTQVNSRSLKWSGTLILSASRRFDIEASATSTLSGRKTLAGTEASLALVWHP